MSHKLFRSTRAGAVLPALMILGAAPQGSSGTVLDGVYSPTQAASGAERYEGTCTRCHTPDHFVAGGLYAPTTRFANLGEMFARISTKMPADDPGSLAPEEYAALIAYILQESGYPPGAAELPTDTSKLSQIRVVPPASAAR